MAQRFRPVIKIAGIPELTHCLRLSISQAIFDHHHFEVVVPSEALEKSPDDTFFQEVSTKLCGKTIEISFEPIKAQDASPGAAKKPAQGFEFKGFITQLRLGGTDDLTNVCIIEGYSSTYLLEDSTQRRTFVDQTLQNICEEVKKGYDDLAWQVDVKHKINKIPYVVQYDENSFTFLKRLAAAHGQWLYYTGQKLIIGSADNTDAVDFMVGGAQSFSLTVSLRPTRLQATGYNYLRHEQEPWNERSASAPRTTEIATIAEQRSMTLFQHTSHVGAGQPVSTVSELRETLNQLEANLTGSLVVFEGVGEDPAVVVGKLIKVKKPTPDGRAAAELGKYRVLAIEHWLDNEGNYFNKFRAIPYEKSGLLPVPWIAPVAGAMELAKVIDVNDLEKLGRIRVQFMWPIAKFNSAAARSGWLRVSTPYSGDGKGQLFTPEVGSQVLVGYEQQQAELPVVLGNLFHDKNPQDATYTRTNNHLKGLQTKGGNKLVLDDTEKAQTILLSNSNNRGTAIKLSFEGDGSITIESEGLVTVKSPEIVLEAGKQGSITLHGKMITIEADELLTLKGDHKTHIRAKTLDATATNVTVHGTATTAIKGGIVDIN